MLRSLKTDVYFSSVTRAEGFIKQTVNACKKTEAHPLEDVVTAWLGKSKAVVSGVKVTSERSVEAVGDAFILAAMFWHRTPLSAVLRERAWAVNVS